MRHSRVTSNSATLKTPPNSCFQMKIVIKWSGQSAIAGGELSSPPVPVVRVRIRIPVGENPNVYGDDGSRARSCGRAGERRQTSVGHVFHGTLTTLPSLARHSLGSVFRLDRLAVRDRVTATVSPVRQAFRDSHPPAPAIDRVTETPCGRRSYDAFWRREGTSDRPAACNKR